MINVLDQAKVIMDMIIYYNRVLKLISCYELRLVIYIKVLVLALLLFKDQKKLFTTFYL